MKRYKKIAAELVVASREVLEVHSSPPPSMTNEHEHNEERHEEGRGETSPDDRWDNTPCTD